MSIRIPILDQQTSTPFVPINPVQALQVDDPRGRALQGLGGALGDFGDALDRRQKQQALNDAKTPQMHHLLPQDSAQQDGASPDSSSQNGTPPPYTAEGWQRQQNNRLWAVDTYAQCVRNASATSGQVIADAAPGTGGASASANPLSGIPGLGAIGDLIKPPGAAAAPTGTGTAATGTGATPTGPGAPADPAAQGITGAYLQGIDQFNSAAIANAPDREAAARLAAQCSTDRARGAGTMLRYEAQANVQQRETRFLGAMQTIAMARLVRDPAALPEMLEFAQANMIQVGAPRQAAFEAQVRATLIGAAMQGQIKADPRGMVLALEHRQGAGQDRVTAGAGGTAGPDGPDGTAGPDNHLAEHPVTQVLTPAEAAHFLPQARAALATAQSNERAAAAQDSAAAIQSYLATGNAQRAPSQAQLISAFGLEEGKQRYAQLEEARSEGNSYVNLRALPSAALHDMDAQERDARGQGQGQAAGESADGAALAPVAASKGSLTLSPSQHAIARILGERQRDPVQAALDSGGYGLAALDLGSAQTAQKGLLARVAPSTELAGQYGVQRRLLTQAEVPKVAALVQALPAQEQAQWLRDFIAGAGDGEASQAVLRQLSAHAPTLAQAGRILLREQGQSGDPGQWGGAGTIDAAEQIVNGSALIRDGKANLPPDQEMRRAFRIGMGETFADQPGEEAMRYEAMVAAYSGLSERAGDKSGKFDQQRWEAAEYLVNVGSGTERDIGLNAAPSPSAEGNTSSAPQDAGSAQPPEEIDKWDLQGSQNVETVGKEGAQGAWGIASKIAGPGASSQEVNRIKNQLLYLNPELAGTVKAGQRYYVPDESTPEDKDTAQQADAQWNQLAEQRRQTSFPATDTTNAPSTVGQQSSSVAVKSEEDKPFEGKRKLIPFPKPGPWGKDEENAFVDQVKEEIRFPRAGTSNNGADELKKKYSPLMKDLIAKGKGSTAFGPEKGVDFERNNFDITKFPEESVHDEKDLTYHKNGVLTYVGPVDNAKGVTKELLVKMLVERYSRPGFRLSPMPAVFSGPSDVYAVSPMDAIVQRDRAKNLEKADQYTYRIGEIEQVRVPDGVVNITTTRHDVYPGTIRRVVVEQDGHLFVLTVGSGVNRYQNEPTINHAKWGIPGPAAVEGAFGSLKQAALGYGNDVYGAAAFSRLDKQLFEDVERFRRGEPLLPEQREEIPKRMPPALMGPSNPKRGVE